MTDSPEAAELANGVLRALVFRASGRVLGLSVTGDHHNLEPFAAAFEGCEWEEVQILYEDSPPEPPEGDGLYRMTWPWRELTATEKSGEGAELCCFYVGEPQWEKLEVASLLRGIGAKEETTLPPEPSELAIQFAASEYASNVAYCQNEDCAVEGGAGCDRCRTIVIEILKTAYAVDRASGSAVPPATSVGVSPSSGAPEEQHG